MIASKYDSPSYVLGMYICMIVELGMLLKKLMAYLLLKVGPRALPTMRKKEATEMRHSAFDLKEVRLNKGRLSHDIICMRASFRA